MSSKRSIVSALLSWFAVNARDLPWRRTRDPYGIWVSEIMLQQTQVKTVIPYWNRWMHELPTIQSLAQASSEKIHKLWEGLGYYTRVRNMQKAAQQIISEHEGKFPTTFEQVHELSGIGRYTTGAICSIAFNQPTPILDGNVIRVLTRVYGISNNPKDKETNETLWGLAKELVVLAEKLKEQQALSRGMHSAGNCSLLNQSLMELGALICTPRQPRCNECPLSSRCVAFQEKLTESIPNLAKRAAATARHFLVLVLENDGKYLVRQRPAGVVNGHLWEFPNWEVTATSETIASFAEQLLGKLTPSDHVSNHETALKLNRKAKSTTRTKATKTLNREALWNHPLCTIKHSITRYRITVEAFHSRLNNRPIMQASEGIWKTPGELKGIALASAHKKILQRLFLPRNLN